MSDGDTPSKWYWVESELDVESQISKLENGLLLIIRGPTSYNDDNPSKDHNPAPTVAVRPAWEIVMSNFSPGQQWAVTALLGVWVSYCLRIQNQHIQTHRVIEIWCHNHSFPGSYFLLKRIVLPIFWPLLVQQCLNMIWSSLIAGHCQPPSAHWIEAKQNISTAQNLYQYLFGTMSTLKNLYLKESLLGIISTWNNLYSQKSLLGTMPTWNNAYFVQCLLWTMPTWNNAYLEQHLLGTMSTWNNLYSEQCTLWTMSTWNKLGYPFHLKARHQYPYTCSRRELILSYCLLAASSAVVPLQLEKAIDKPLPGLHR